MARGSTCALMVLAVLGCGQSAPPPRGAGGGGGEETGGAGTGGAAAGGTGGSQPARPDAASDLGVAREDAAARADVVPADLGPASPDSPPATGPARIVLVAGGGTGGDGSPAMMARLSIPFGTAVDPLTGDIYIAEFTGRIRKIDDKGIIGTVVGPGAPAAAGMVRLDEPHDLLFQPGTRNLFIADTIARRVVKLDAATGTVTPFAGAGTQVAPGIGRTFHLAFDRPGERLYVTDFEGAKVAIIDMKTSAVTSLNVGNNPRSIAVDSKRNLYVVNNNMVMRRFDPMGGGGTMVVGGLMAPKHLTVDNEDNVIICETERQLIRKWTPGASMAVDIAGTGARGTGTLGGAPEQAGLARPHGVFVDAQGRIYIADSNNDRVLRIER